MNLDETKSTVLYLRLLFPTALNHVGIISSTTPFTLGPPIELDAWIEILIKDYGTRYVGWVEDNVVAFARIERTVAQGNVGG